MITSKKIKINKQFLKYCLVGISGTLIDLASLYVFVEYLNIPVIPASVLSFLLAVINNFIWNKAWTFRSKSKNYRKLFIKFLIVSTVGLLLTVSFMYLFVELLAIWYMLAKIITSGVVLSWNFLGNKLWTFKLNQTDKSSAPKHQFDLSIIIPAYNEGNRITGTLLIISDYIEKKKIDCEIIVVSDGSVDNTNKIVQQYSKKIPQLRLETYEENQGKGYAVNYGVEKAQGKLILFTDADNSTPIEELENLEKELKVQGADIAIGSRYLPNSNVEIKQPLYRIIFSRAGNLLIRMILIDGIKDTQCGFKLFKGEVAKEIFSFQKIHRFGFDMEALVVANNLGHKIIEVPVSWFNSCESRVRPVKDGLRTLKDLVYIKINLWSGRYSND
jgi:dolichyl-phosphate beta-glucosyltransferase